MRRNRKKWSPAQRSNVMLFVTSRYTYRVFVTNLDRPVDLAVWFYNQRAGPG
jgi:hypothetical protein